METEDADEEYDIPDEIEEIIGETEILRKFAPVN